MKSILKNIPVRLTGDIFPRAEQCRICGAMSGRRIGEAEYWDLGRSYLIQCLKCRHIQLDPMPSADAMAEGCRAYYIEETLRTSLKEAEKNCERNFRRGVVFGYKLKRRNINPQAILEIGPGSGYFSAGLRYVFPDAVVTVLDVNRAVLEFNAENHGFATIEGVPEDRIEACTAQFDLVIARDVLEHVGDITGTIGNIVSYMKSGGYFHFITPNGHEDVWKHYLAFMLARKPSELLINHVNYFDGRGLKTLLVQDGLLPVDYFTYNFKHTLRGSGRKNNPVLMAPPSRNLSAAQFIRDNAPAMKELKPDKRRILGKWYIRCGIRRITWLWSYLHHYLLFKVSPEYNVGHEISGIFRKKSDSPW